MVFPTASTHPRPIRLNEQIRDWAWRSMHGEFGDDAMTAMFIGLITAYMGSYVGTLVQLRGGALVVTGEYLPLVTMAFAALAMWAFTWLAEKKKMAWLENFSIAGSMLVGMAAAVICNMIF